MRRVVLAVAVLLILTACTPQEMAWWTSRVDEAQAEGRPCPVLAPSIEGAGLPESFAFIIHRESRCRAGMVNTSSGALGLTQVMPEWVPALCNVGIACSEAALLEVRANLLAAAFIFTIQGWQAWATS